MKLAIRTTIFMLTCALLGAEIPAAQASEKIVTIGTAGVTGVYYPAGGAICRLVNRSRKESGIRCVVESTGGSINNLEAIHKDDLDMGVVQSDLLYDAFTGREIFSDVTPDKNMRVLFALHSEPFTVIARKESKIKTFNDLKGKKVYLGAPGSGMRATMEELMQVKGWTNKTFGAIVDLKSNDQALALCSGKIDAMVYAGGHPNGFVQQVTSLCSPRLISVEGPEIDRMIDDHSFYAHATIPGGMYLGNPQPVKTFGVRAELVGSTRLDNDIAYQIVKSVFDNLDNFKTLHPVFATLNAPQMIAIGDDVPLHDGAIKYYKEKGLIQ